MPTLSPSEIEQRLKRLSGWKLEGNAIRKQFTFAGFPQAVAFVNALVPEAEAADHHPDIHVNYTRVTFICSTHTDGGVSDKDIKLAGEIEKAFAAR